MTLRVPRTVRVEVSAYALEDTMDIKYAEELIRQNQGEKCSHCGASSGHFSVCPLINREVAEARSAALTEGDTILLRGLGVKW